MAFTTSGQETEWAILTAPEPTRGGDGRKWGDRQWKGIANSWGWGTESTLGDNSMELQVL